MSLAAKVRRAPLRLATGAFILNAGVGKLSADEGTAQYLQLGYPLSTTHVVSGAVMGSGATRRLSAVRWGVAGNIVVAWILTIPASAAVAALFYFPVRAIF